MTTRGSQKVRKNWCKAEILSQAPSYVIFMQKSVRNNCKSNNYHLKILNQYLLHRIYLLNSKE